MCYLTCTKMLPEWAVKLKGGRGKRDAEKGQLHKVFEDSFDAKSIYHESF